LATVTNLINKALCRIWTPEIVKSSRLDIDPDWRFAISSTTTNLPKPVKDPSSKPLVISLLSPHPTDTQTMMAMMLIRSGNISILAQAAIIASPTTIANPNMLLYQRMQMSWWTILRVMAANVEVVSEHTSFMDLIEGGGAFVRDL
jgi:hypothetical protein